MMDARQQGSSGHFPKAEVGTGMGGGQENRSSRWGVPLAVVLLARASCHSLGLSLGPASPLSQQNEPIFIFRLVVLIALKLAHMKLRIAKQTGQHSAWEFHFSSSHVTKENIGVCYIFLRNNRPAFL